MKNYYKPAIVGETEILKACKEYLGVLEKQRKLYFIRNNSGGSKTKSGFIRYGKSGSADLLLSLPNGVFIHCEAKTEKGTQSDAQKEAQALLEHLGHIYVIIRSLSDLEILLKKYKVIS